MSESDSELKGPDLAIEGVAASDIAEGDMFLGHANGEPVVVTRRGDAFVAFAGKCTHYGGPLAEGVLDGDTVRCPWHHACFNVRTGEAAAPALDGIAAFTTRVEGGTVRVGAQVIVPAPTEPAGAPRRIVIIGGGAAGNAAAEMLRREGYGGSIQLVSSTPELPCDRPNLSKDYLAGTAEESWLSLRSPDFYEEQRIEVLLGRTVERIDTAARTVITDDARTLAFDALLLATGADPVHLDIPGANLPHVFTLRTVADSKAIIAAAEAGSRAVVIGASFIGLEVAASLRARDIEVHVIAPEERPMERILGAELGDFVRALHEEHGVHFHLGQTAVAIEPGRVTLKNGSVIEADFVVEGVGVRPSLRLAEAAGLALDRGVVVDEFLETSVKGIYAAGDIARWPDAYCGQSIRVEHWVVAERQGQAAARNILGRREPFAAVPFFWSQHYDVPINYVGHAEGWDRIDITGNVTDRDCVVAYRKGGKTLAVASIYRDLDSLKAELAMERRSETDLSALVPPT